jgi:hypothetical protein
MRAGGRSWVRSGKKFQSGICALHRSGAERFRVQRANGPRLSAAPTALRSSSGLSPQPFRAGLTFSGRPSGPLLHGDFAVSFLSQLATGELAVPTARRGRRDDKGEGSAGTCGFFSSSHADSVSRSYSTVVDALASESSSRASLAQLLNPVKRPTPASLIEEMNELVKGGLRSLC